MTLKDLEFCKNVEVDKVTTMGAIKIYTSSPINANLGRKREQTLPNYEYIPITFPFKNPFSPKLGVYQRRRKHSISSVISNVDPANMIPPKSPNLNNSTTPQSATFTLSRKSSFARGYKSPSLKSPSLRSPSLRGPSPRVSFVIEEVFEDFISPKTISTSRFQPTPRIEVSNEKQTIDWTAYQFLEDDQDFLPEEDEDEEQQNGWYEKS